MVDFEHWGIHAGEQSAKASEEGLCMRIEWDLANQLKTFPLQTKSREGATGEI